MENKNNNAPAIPPCAPYKPQNGILVFGIGVLVGAIIATAAFMLGAHSTGRDKQMMEGRQMPQMQQMQGGPQDAPGKRSKQQPRQLDEDDAQDED